MKQGDSADWPTMPGPEQPAAPAAQPEPARRSLKTSIIGGMLVVALVLLGLETWSRYQARQTDLADAAVAAVNIARAAAEHVESTLGLADAGLLDLLDRMRQDGAAAPALQPMMQARLARNPALAGMLVLDGAGVQVAAVSLSTPAALPASMPPPAGIGAAPFDWHRGHPGPAVHLSAPVLDGASWVLPISRAVAAADGSLAGVAVATVRLSAIQAYFGAFDIGADGVFVLALDQGTLITRRPYRPDLIGSDIRRGPIFKLIGEQGVDVTAVRLGLQDQVRRTYCVRRVASYPLIVAASLAHHEMLAAWYQATAAEAAVLALALALLFKGARVLLAQLSLRDQAEARSRSLQQELERSNRALRDMAMKDGLTGLSNRRELDTQLDAELARASRAAASLALVMFDVDHFKRYNDHYGHAAGDACLRAVARAIDASGRRPGDTAARFGGEEFAILLPDTDLAGARAVAIAVCEAVCALQLPHADSEVGMVTVSAGIAALRPGPASTAGELIEAADRGLYLAKAAGRNRVGSTPAHV